jgi:hypothetical protein
VEKKIQSKGGLAKPSKQMEVCKTELIKWKKNTIGKTERP